MTRKDLSEFVQILCRQGVGQSVRSLDVYGINSLKSVDPPVSALSGQSITGAEVNGDGIIAILIGDLRVRVNLERTGRVVWHQSLAEWSRTTAASPPTARLLLENGSGFDFVEPAKTKRITFTIQWGGDYQVE